MDHGRERDTTDDWLVPDDFGREAEAEPSPGPRPAVLEDTIRAASAAERAAMASLVAVEAAGRAEATLWKIEKHLDRAIEMAQAAGAPAAAPRTEEEPPEEPSLRRFTERADRLLERLRTLEQRPLPTGSGGNGRPLN